MELTKDISGEQLPTSNSSLVSEDTKIDFRKHISKQDLQTLTKDELTERIQTILLERIQGGDQQALFQLAQLYFEQEDYAKARDFFERAAEVGDFQSMFQLGVIYYDGLLGEAEHKKGIDYMVTVANSTAKKAKHLLFAAQFNVGRAYFQGFGVKQSDAEAERYWLMAADDGNPKASIKAQSILGMLYSLEDTRDLKKAFFWHSEACGNGSLESQGALGVMYQYGIGCRKDVNSAFICFREAAERGNVNAMGNLVAYYYRIKLYTKTIELAARVAQLNDVEQIALETDCIPGYISKGIAIACFYYARCLHLGLGCQPDDVEAKKNYSRSYSFDADICARLQNVTQHGAI